MADITPSSICTSFEAQGKLCRLNGLPCPFVDGNPRDCADSTYATRVSMPPDEFIVMFNAQGHPALGTLTIIRCKQPELHQAVAGVHVNVILDTIGDEALLQAQWKLDGSVEFFCPASEVRVLWRDGKFIPL